MPLKHLKLEWSRAIMQMPKDHIKSHVYIKEKPFLPSYCEEGRPNMYKLLGWEYFRMWKKEHDHYDGTRKRNETIKFIKPELKKKSSPEKKTKDKSKPFIMKKFKNVDARTDHKGLEPKKLRAKRLQNEDGNNEMV